ncbi:MAG: hypothetical protein ACOZQL_39570 [Myxococcota bacterium]
MSTLVLPLGILPTGEGNAFALLALFEDGRIGIELDRSWAAAGAKLARMLSGEVTCDATLATVAARVGWKAVAPTREQLLRRAAIAFCFANELPPEATSLAERFCDLWSHFFPMRLWEHVPAETAFRVLRRRARASEHLVAILGQAGQEFGFAWYDDPAAFAALWNGEPILFDGFSVLADDSAFLEPSFRALGVPPPTVTLSVRSEPRAPDGATLQLSRAVMELLVHAFHDGFAEPVALGDGSTLELSFTRPKKSEKKPTKKPAGRGAAKKPARKKPAR